jgi:hypothetical protein
MPVNPEHSAAAVIAFGSIARKVSPPALAALRLGL